MLRLDPQGFVQHWDGGAFHHCFGPGVDLAVAGAAADEASALTGVPRTQAGPCNVNWVRATDPGHSETVVSGTARAITHATVTLRDDTPAMARHEMGHVLGLQHSPREWDLMNASPRVDDFGGDERTVVAWVFGR